MNKQLSVQESAETSDLPSPVAVRGEGRSNDHGVALVITLLLLFLMSVIGLAAVLTASSDMLINGFYSNYRGSFYAADSGLNIARQAMYNQVTASFNTNYATFTTPPPSATTSLATTVNSYMNANYGGGGPCLGNPTPYATSTTCYLSSGSPNNTWNGSAGAATNSWAESYTITNATIALASGYPLPGYTSTSGPITSYSFLYNYSLTAVGSATGSEKSTINEHGSFIVNVSGAPASYTESFAIYGAFITNYGACSGALVPGTMTGPMFTDGQWGFESGGAYVFTDSVGQVGNNASYYINGNCTQAAASSYTSGGQTVAPQFQSGFSRGQASVPQPANSYNQMWAAIDGIGQGEAHSPPTNADMNASLKNISGAAYPSGGASTGVFANYATVNGTPTIQGGGLYIQGNASIVLSTSGSSAQVYTITQGGTTTTMTVDPVANTTVLRSGATTLTLSGVPTNASIAPAQAGTMIYDNGTISSLSGTGEGAAAIQNGAAVTISAASNINITGDVRYATEPVTTTTNQIPGTPIDTIIPANNHGQDLGIFTANGNIVLSSSYADQNLEVDGSQAALGSGCGSSSCGFTVSGCINTFNNVGGQIQTNIFGACMNTENTYYDRRYNTISGFAPPWFPSTTVTNTAGTSTPPVFNLQRTQWVATSGQ